MRNMPSSRRTLFFEDIAVSCTSEHIRMLMEPFGNIEEIVLKSGNDLLEYEMPYGFVRFEKSESAIFAKDRLNHTFLHGKDLR